MKKIITLAITFTFFTGCALTSNKKKKSIKTEKERYSYYIGHQVAQNIKRGNFDIDLEAFDLAIKDILGGKNSRLSDAELREAGLNLVRLNQLKEQAALKKTLLEGEKFLDENQKKSGVKETASGLQYEILQEGTGEKPVKESKVRVHYRGTLIDGTEVDSSYKRNKPAEFKLNQVIKGWTEGLQLMKVGAKYRFAIPAELGYGPRRTGPIPGNSVLIFEVELLDILK